MHLERHYMCSRPITQDGFTFACRSCNECISTRRRSWVARAMMEKATNPHCIILTLTYNEDTPENRDAARMFAYIDVREFMWRLRRAMSYRYPGAYLRFICAGEQGDEGSRCHWHIVIYSSHEIPLFGDFYGFKRGHRGKAALSWPDDKAHMLTVENDRKRLDWSIWGKGFVTLQEASEAGMSYVLSYVLKDQFTEEKSRDTMRYAKSDNFGTGLFRMSKFPAIGDVFLYRRLEQLCDTGQCLPSLNLKVPGMKGYYHPSGSFRKKMLWGLVALIKRVRWATGDDAPQWSTLLHSLSENPPDMEILNGTHSEETAEISLELDIQQRGRAAAGRAQASILRDQCGRGLPCRACLDFQSDETIRSLGLRRYFWRDEDGNWQGRYAALEGFKHNDIRRSDFSGGLNPFCRRKGETAHRHAFPGSVGRDEHAAKARLIDKARDFGEG